MNKKPDKIDYYKSIKLPLKYILKNTNVNLPKITNAVIMCNKIVINTLMFIKLYLLDYIQKNKTLPNIDKVFVNSCMKILCNEHISGRPSKKEIKELKDNLTNFYNINFKPLIKDTKLEYTNLNTVLDYLTINIITMYENNIKLHYIEYVERYINVIFNKKESIKKLKKEEINEFCRQLRLIKNDILDLTNKFKSDIKYHKQIIELKKIIIPNKEKFKKDNIYYDLQCNPQEYMLNMINMMNELESKDIMIYNIFPMRNDIIPKSIKLDTTTLVHLLFTKKQGNKTDYLFKGNLKKQENEIWKFFFKTERRCFKNKNFTFNHMIETDGVSCSILLMQNKYIGKKIHSQKLYSNEKYIDEITDYTHLKNKKIIAYDPGMSDLIYCVDNDNKTANEFRYTQDSRRKECKLKKYQKIILEFKKEKIDDKTIIEYESDLSKLNKKTLNIDKFKEYIKQKSELNNKLLNFYDQYIFRKLKLNTYINIKKHEQNMINKFQEKFGTPDEVVICAGDWEQKQHMKYKEPVKGRGIRKLFKDTGYDLYLVDEYKTSCLCSKCEIGICEKFINRKNPKPYKSGDILVHGATRCKNCNAVWNRDVNGATNIYKISKNMINGLERPDYLNRETKSVKVDALTKQNLHIKP